MSGIITAAAITAGAGMYGQHQSNKAAKRNRRDQQPFMDFQKKSMLPWAQDRLSSSGQQYDSASNFWNKLATGGREGYMEVLGPQMAALGNQQAAARNSALELGGRGGMSAAMAAQPVMDLAKQQGNAMLAMKPMAMGQVADLAAQQGALGINAGNSGSGNMMDMYRLQNQQSNDQFNKDAAYGQAIAQAVGGIDWTSLFGNRGAAGGAGAAKAAYPSSGSINSPTWWANAYNSTMGR